MHDLASVPTIDLWCRPMEAARFLNLTSADFADLGSVGDGLQQQLRDSKLIA